MRKKKDVTGYHPRVEGIKLTPRQMKQLEPIRRELFRYKRMHGCAGAVCGQVYLADNTSADPVGTMMMAFLNQYQTQIIVDALKYGVKFTVGEKGGTRNRKPVSRRSKNQRSKGIQLGGGGEAVSSDTETKPPKPN